MKNSYDAYNHKRIITIYNDVQSDQTFADFKHQTLTFTFST